MESSLIFAFTVGLFSTIHCVGMCGAIIGALSFSLPADIRQNRWRSLPYLLAYNLGRIISYSAAGALIGWLGITVFQSISPKYGHTALIWFAAAFMFAIGLYLAGWFPNFAYLENIGKPVWRRLEPVGRRLLPVNSLTQALGFGLIWGWLPCGLVYAAVVYAASTGSAANGAMFMAFFGLGTLPVVLSAGILTNWITRLAQMPRLKQSAGVFIIILAMVTLYAGFSTQHGHAMHYFHIH